jgi:SAM-dependent methyltransferase
MSDEIREEVRRKYAAIARGEDACCAPRESACGTAAETDGDADTINMIGEAYQGVDGYEASADLQLGCGIPTEHAGLEEGQAVVDLGSGAGLDAFVARRIVGESGRVVGLDFASEMVEKARRNAEDHGVENVFFVEGEIEAMPLETASFDVALSNCVFNLVPDKGRAFDETHRILRPGGHFCISDVVHRGELPDPIRRSAELYAGCVAGSMEENAYLELIEAAGFEDVQIRARSRIEVPDSALPEELSEEQFASFREGGLFSLTVHGRKPQ